MAIFADEIEVVAVLGQTSDDAAVETVRETLEERVVRGRLHGREVAEASVRIEAL